MAISLDLQYAMVFDENNLSVLTSFHHLSPEDSSRFKHVLQIKTRTWHQNATTKGVYCGSFLEAEGVQGNEKGCKTRGSHPINLDQSPTNHSVTVTYIEYVFVCMCKLYISNFGLSSEKDADRKRYSGS